jgi:FkbM family methyltransferase
MKNLLVKIARKILLKLLNQKNIESILINLANVASIDILNLAYYQIGILKYWNEKVSGEYFVIQFILKKYFKNEQPVIFDVGANNGKYSANVQTVFPHAIIYAFEPNPNTFKLLCQNLRDCHIKCYELGFSSQTKKQTIFTYVKEKTSGHATFYENVLLDLHKSSDVIGMQIKTITLDEFCNTNKIDHIHFLKIDTEGHEMEVLKGAKEMIMNNRIDIIQFEFNEMNIISRVFLKDFYEILNNYKLHRLDSSRLIPLFNYESKNEIFKFQNFLAIHSNFFQGYE